MLAENLSRAWAERCATTAIDPVLRFSNEGLVLGAGTVLAASQESPRNVAVQSDEPRLLALLTAAHQRRPHPNGLAHLRKAAQHWGAREDALASMHLVLSELDRLRQPDADARRLFLADSLLREGVDASVILDAICSDDTPADALEKTFNPNQPRAPAGSGRTSGQWISTDGGSPGNGPPATRSRNGTLISPAIAARRHVGDDSCHLATRDCIYHAGQGPRGTLKDRVIDATDVAACVLTGDGCEGISFAVDAIPGVYDGGAIFGDGGIVIMKKGFEDVYIPSRRYPPVPR